MKIERDAEWTRLESVVDEVEDRLSVIRSEARVAREALSVHAKQYIAGVLGITVGETVVKCDGGRYLVTDVQDCLYDPWIYGRKFRKDGTPGERETRIYGNWVKATD